MPLLPLLSLPTLSHELDNCTSCLSNLDANCVHSFSTFFFFQIFTSSCFTLLSVSASAQTVHALSKEAFCTLFHMMASFHWRTLIAEGFLPTIPRWRALITDLNFWQRLVSKSLCRFVRRAASRGLHLTTKQRRRLFWIRIERCDPARETPVGPRAIPYTVWVSREARHSHHRGEDLVCTRYLRLLSAFPPVITLSAQKSDG